MSTCPVKTRLREDLEKDILRNIKVKPVIHKDGITFNIPADPVLYSKTYTTLHNNINSIMNDTKYMVSEFGRIAEITTDTYHIGITFYINKNLEELHEIKENKINQEEELNKLNNKIHKKNQQLRLPFDESRNIQSESQKIGQKLISFLLNRLSKVIKLNYKIVDFNIDPTIEYYGINKNNHGALIDNIVYINKNNIALDTPIHEFGHALLYIIKQKYPKLYENLIKEILDQKIIYGQIKLRYSDLSEDAIIDEAIVTAIGYYGANMINTFTKALTQLIKNVFNSVLSLLGVHFAINEKSNIAELASLLLSGKELDEAYDNKGVSESRSIFSEDIGEIKSENFVENPSNTDTYIKYENGIAKIITRVTSFIANNLSGYRKKDGISIAESVVTKLFREQRQNVDTGKIIYQGDNKAYTFKEAVIRTERKHEQSRLRGKIIHSYVEYFLTKDSIVLKKYEEYLKDYKKVLGEDDFSYLTEANVKNLLIGLNIKLEDATPDKIMSEFKVMSDDITIEGSPLGGTIDLLIKHHDGSYSIIDFKTGGLNDKDSNVNFKYTDIEQNKLNTAGVQTMLYAMILKSKHPNIKFRNIQMVYIDKRGNTQIKDLNINKYSVELGKYFKVVDKKVYDANKHLFDYKDYYAISSDLAELINKEVPTGKFEDVVASKQRLLQILYSKLESLYAEYGQDGVYKSSKARAVEKSILKAISQLEGSEFGNIFTIDKNSDMTLLEKMTSVGFNVKLPAFKLFMKLYQRALNFYYDKRKTTLNTLHEKLTPVIEEYYKKSTLGSVVSKSEFLKNYLNFITYKELFNFAWKDTEFGLDGITEFDFVGRNLTNAQKEYLIEMHTQIRNAYFTTLSTEEGINYYENRIKNITSDPLVAHWNYTKALDFLTNQKKLISEAPKSTKIKYELRGFKYYDGFMPRINETFEEKDLIGKGRTVKYQAISLFKNNSRTVEEERNRYGVPLKYFGNSLDTQNERFSLNASLATAAFIENLYFKQSMDNVFLIGKGIENWLNDFKDTQNHAVYNQSLEWIQNYLKNNIELASDDTAVFTSDTNGRKIARAITTFVSLSKYAMMPASIIKNLVMEQLYNIVKAAAGSMAKHLGGNKFQGTITMSLLFKGYLVYAQHIGNMIINNLHNDKLHNLDSRYNLLYNSREYVVGQKEDPSLRNRGISTNSLFAINNLSEEFGLAVIKVAAMHAIKDNNGVSMWDNYNDKGEYTGGVRGILKNGDKVEGFTEQEIFAINKIATTAHGEYSPDHKNMLGGTAWGILVTQFHKYLPNLFERGWQGTFEAASIGQLSFVKDKNGKILEINAIPVLEWESQQITGTGRLGFKALKFMYNSVFTAIGFMNDKKTFKHFWQDLSIAEKEALYLLMSQFGMAMFLSGFTIALYGDAGSDDDKDKVKKLVMNLKRDMYTEANPADIAGMLRKPFVFGETFYQLQKGTSDFIFKGGYAGKRNTKGDIYGSKAILKNIPVTSQYLTTEEYLESDIFE